MDSCGSIRFIIIFHIALSLYTIIFYYLFIFMDLSFFFYKLHNQGTFFILCLSLCKIYLFLFICRQNNKKNSYAQKAFSRKYSNNNNNNYNIWQDTRRAKRTTLYNLY